MDENSWAEIYNSIRNKEGTTVIQSFLDAGLDVNSLGSTMLFCAAECGNIQVVEFLVQNGADGNIVDRFGCKPIHNAARYGCMDIVKFFLNIGIDLECRCNNGETILHYAIRGGHLDLLKFLVSNGCDINDKGFNGSTPLNLAVIYSYPEIIEYLVESRADIDCRNTNGWGVLHEACFTAKSPDIVKYLIKKGCNVNAQEKSQNTPLHFAIWYATMEIVEDLLNAGADFNVENESGQTPFDVIIESPVCLKGIALFLEKGAYFQPDDYNFIIDEPVLKEGILQNIKLCTQSVINKFNYSDLPKVYERPVVSQKLPPIEKMKIPSLCNRAQNIAESINYEIRTKGYCNVPNVYPNMLFCICARFLIQHM